MANALERWFDRRSFSPPRDFSRMQDSIERFFSDFGGLRSMDNGQGLVFSPSCEVSEEKDNYVLKFDLPGVAKDQVRVEVEGDRLTVHAERKEEKKEESRKKYLSEIYYGSYTRSFTMPGPVDESKVVAKFDNGVLTVRVPKTEVQSASQIPVN